MENIIESFQNHLSSYSKNLDNDILNLSNENKKEYLYDEINLSIIIICKNEKRSIERCLKAIIQEKNIKDEIVVIDTGSTDGTIEKILKYSNEVRLLKLDWKDSFSEIRNYGIKKSNYNWIFFIDADEELVEGSIANLKKYILILQTKKIKNTVINPTIINSNGHIVQGVRRILNKKENIHYYGLIHEEPRINDSKLGTDVSEISFDNIQLKHDGYEDEVMKNKNKIQRNVGLLRIMNELEPYYPRWTYFLSRDGKEILDPEEYQNLLQKTIKLCKDIPYYRAYKTRALSDLIAHFISKGKLKEAEKKLIELKIFEPELSDVFYFQNVLSILHLKSKFFEILNDIITFRKNKEEIEYGSMHSNLFHIDYLIGELFFEIEEYDKAFNIFNKLKENNFNIYGEKYENLYNAMKKSFYNKN